MNSFKLLNKMFNERRDRLNSIAVSSIRQGDIAPRSNKVLQEINSAIFENHVTDRELLGRFIF